MNRKERRNLRKDKDLVKELYSIINKYLPKLLDMFESLTDVRNQSYVTYKMKTICILIISIQIYVLKTFLKYVIKIWQNFPIGKRFKMYL